MGVSLLTDYNMEDIFYRFEVERNNQASDIPTTLQEQAGLTDVGVDEFGNTEWMGTPQQWAEFEKLEEENN